MKILYQYCYYTILITFASLVDNHEEVNFIPLKGREYVPIDAMLDRKNGLRNPIRKSSCPIIYSHLEGPCSHSCMCIRLTGLTCDLGDGLCKCQERNTYWSGEKQSCLKFRDYAQSCDETFKCNFFNSGLICSRSLHGRSCDCIMTHYYDTKYLKCLPRSSINGRCHYGKDYMCVANTGLGCDFYGYCKCTNENQVWSATLYKCVGNVGAKCKTSLDCYENANIACLFDVCTCNPPWKWDADSNKCVCLGNLVGTQCLGSSNAICDMTKSPPIVCDKSIANFGCSAPTEPGVCQCNPPWQWDSATKTCICFDPLYRLVGTSCVALNGAECDPTAIPPVLCDASANLVCSTDDEAGTCQCDPTALAYWNPTTVTCVPICFHSCHDVPEFTKLPDTFNDDGRKSWNLLDCINLCITQYNSKYAAIQKGQYCDCTNRDFATNVDLATCSYQCPDFPDLATCGGDLAFSIYSTTCP